MCLSLCLCALVLGSVVYNNIFEVFIKKYWCNNQMLRSSYITLTILKRSTILSNSSFSITIFASTHDRVQKLFCQVCHVNDLWIIKRTRVHDPVHVVYIQTRSITQEYSDENLKIQLSSYPANLNSRLS